MTFEKGHLGWNKGGHVSEETKQKISIANKGNFNLGWNKGKHLSEETKRKISVANKGKQFSEEHKLKLSLSLRGKISWNKGKISSIETRKKMSLSHIGKIPWNKNKKGVMPIAWNRGKKTPLEIIKKLSLSHIGKIPWMKGKKHTEESKKKMGHEISWKGKKRNELIKQKIKETKNLPENKEKARLNRLKLIIPFKDTTIERMLQDELSIRGYGYYKHHPILGQPDIAFPDKKIVVFCDGCYWHSCEKCKRLKNEEMQKKIKEKDARVLKYLNENGWLVLRYWEHEINTNIEGVVDEIEDVIWGRNQ